MALLLLSAVSLITMACFAYLLCVAVTMESSRPFQHFSVAIVVIPLSFLAAMGVQMGYNVSAEIVATLTGFVVPPLDEELTLSDIQALSCLIFLEYGFMIIAIHLVDIMRYLKIARRRALVRCRS